MRHHAQAILLGTVLTAALAACSSTPTQTQPASAAPVSGTSDVSGTAGSSGAAGSTGSGSGVDTSGNNSRLTPPPVTDPSSTGTVIDDRINEDKQVPKH